MSKPPPQGELKVHARLFFDWGPEVVGLAFSVVDADACLKWEICNLVLCIRVPRARYVTSMVDAHTFFSQK